MIDSQAIMGNVLSLFAQSFGISTENAFLLLILLMVWSLTWKGFALWKAAKLSQRNWFIVLLVLNTLGILEIFYIFLVAKKKETSQNN